LIGATDGHAKNFSLFLRRGGRFRMTPLYDVMSAEPSVAAGQITRRQAKLAMSLGKSRHYRLDEIMPRHLEQTAALAGIDPRIVRGLYREFLATAEAKASRLAEEMEGSVPDAIRLPILEAIRGRLRLIAMALG
jgi:serine/threonine-protein kinase HipA